MARFLLLACFILANSALLVSLAMANAPAPSPSSNRKMAMPTWSVSPPASIDEGRTKTAKAPVEEAAGKDSSSTHSKGGDHVSVNQPGLVEPANQEPELAEGPSRTNKRQRKHTDKSIAFGGVILGGLAATFVVSIIRYIRATRRRDEHRINPTPSTASTPTTPRKMPA